MVRTIGGSAAGRTILLAWGCLLLSGLALLAAQIANDQVPASVYRSVGAVRTDPVQALYGWWLVLFPACAAACAPGRVGRIMVVVFSLLAGLFALVPLWLLFGDVLGAMNGWCKVMYCAPSAIAGSDAIAHSDALQIPLHLLAFSLYSGTVLCPLLYRSRRTSPEGGRKLQGGYLLWRQDRGVAGTRIHPCRDRNGR